MGFTVLEILVALVIISIAVVSVIQLFSINLGNLRKSDEQTEAMIIANTKMREVLEQEKIEDIERTETDEAGNIYTISAVEILDKRTENLPVKLEEITLTLNYHKSGKEKKITLKTAKTFSRVETLKPSDVR